MFLARPAILLGRRSPVGLIIAALVLLAACSSSGTPAPTAPTSNGTTASATPAQSPAVAMSPAGTITLYTSVTQSTVDAVVKGFTDAHPEIIVDVFRAPTAEVAARIATDLASGGLRADVLWLTDPLSIAGYADQKLLQAWTPPSAAGIDPAYRTNTSFGTRLLNMVLITGAAVTPGPADWKDLL